MVPLLEESGNKFEGRHLYASSGQFGKREIDLLRMWNSQSKG